MKYFPIVGELRDDQFVVNVIFFDDVHLGVVSGKKNTCEKLIFNRGEKVTIGDFTFDSSFDLEGFNILNCDCQFVGECGLKEQVKNNSVNFHIGDQIYLDAVFLDACRNGDDNLKQTIYEEYRKAFERKKDILQKNYNIMLGDDHEIADETLRQYDKYGITPVFLEVYNEIQKGLRFDDSPLVTYGDNDFLLVENIETRPNEEYSRNITNLINLGIFTKPNMYILTTRNILNTKDNFINKIIYSSNDNIINYRQFYETIFSWEKKVTIICGDEHCCGKFLIKRGNKQIEYYLNGPLNSVPEMFDGEYFLKTENLSVEYLENKYGFIEITNGQIKHNMLDISCIGHNFAAFQYAITMLPKKIRLLC